MSQKAEEKTRAPSQCPVFGSPSELRDDVLPTHSDIMKYYLLVRHQLETQSVNKETPSVGEVAKRVAAKTEQIWQTTSIPIVSQYRIVQMIRAYHDKHRKLLKPFKSRQGNKSYENKLKKFQEDGKKLFDIAACKCMVDAACHCTEGRKVPVEYQAFLADQRCDRKLMIHNLMRNEMQQIETRKLLEPGRMVKAIKCVNSQGVLDTDTENV